MTRHPRLLLLVILGSVAYLPSLLPAEKAPDLAAQLREVNANVIAPESEKGKQLPQMLSADARARIREANQRETKLWRELKNKADWEKYRDVRIAALRQSLGEYPAVAKDLKVKVTRTIEGDGYKIENLVFESRPGLVVTANLYSPKEPGKAMPGIVICPSHHNPKTQGELQDMGMTWARLGALVIVLDNLGHGERRQHPFVDEKSYPGTFRAGRQDYYFRYNTAAQLYLIGDSLAGWLAWDLSRCVDVLLARPGVDKDKIVLLGSVAGGGDPAAVAAALDPRIAAVVPFNFGGPQPETIFPLPADAEAAFNYAGGGSWESTRNLRLSARDGFLPWVIVGSAAPRGVIHAHEFAWDKDRDPVWTRYQKIFEWYNAADKLAAANGRGSVTGRPPEATHCNNIGPEHRAGLYPSLNKWFGMAAIPEKEYKQRHKSDELLCLTNDVPKPKTLSELTTALGAERAAQARQKLAALPAAARVKKLQDDWTKLLGDVEPAAPKATVAEPQKLDNVTIERITLEVEPNVVVPTLLLLPAQSKGTKLPVVVAFAQHGKQRFLKDRADVVAELLAGNVAVCLPDLRGTGETRPGDSRGRGSNATSIAATELMAGRTMVGLRLRDLRSVIRYLRERPDLDGKKLALWGDSFAPVNPEDRRVDVPLDAEKFPEQAEPLGGVLALLAALYEPDVRAVYAQGGLTGYQSVLQSPFCYLSLDVLVPGALTTGDLCDVAAALSPRPVRLEGLVDGLNRRASPDTLGKTYEPTRVAYKAAGAENRLVLGEVGKEKPAAWLMALLK